MTNRLLLNANEVGGFHLRSRDGGQGFVEGNEEKLFPKTLPTLVRRHTKALPFKALCRMQPPSVATEAFKEQMFSAVLPCCPLLCCRVAGSAKGVGCQRNNVRVMS